MMLAGISHGHGLGAITNSYGLAGHSHVMGLGANVNSYGLAGSCTSHCMGLGGLGATNFWPAWLIPAVAGGVAAGLYLHYRDARKSQPVSGLGRSHRRRVRRWF